MCYEKGNWLINYFILLNRIAVDISGKVVVLIEKNRKDNVFLIKKVISRDIFGIVFYNYNIIILLL